MKFDGALAKHPSSEHIGQLITPCQDVANYFAEIKFEPDAIEPSYKPFRAPKLTEGPWAIPDMEFKRAAEEGSLRQAGMSAKQGFPSLAQRSATQLGCVVAGELAGTRDDVGGIGPQVAKLADIASVTCASN